MLVISADDDLKQAAQASGHIRHMERLEELLEKLTLEDTAVAERVALALQSQRPELKRLITDKFEWAGFYLSDQEGDVLSVQVTDVETTEIYVTDIDGDLAYFEAHAAVLFDAEVKYADMATATYDSEEKRPMFWRDVETTVERDVQVTATGTATYFVDGGIELSVEEFDLDTGDFGVQAEIWDEY